MKRVLITGTHSFIGNALAANLARHGGEYHVEKLSLRGDGWRGEDLSRFDCVLHVAGLAHTTYKNTMAGQYMAVNRDLTLTFARAAKAAGVKQFIFTSSMIVYGNAAPAGKTRVVTADTAPAPENAYGLSKLQAEEGLFAMEDDGFSVAALRVPTVYGRGCRGGYATLAHWADRLALFPACGGQRSVIYVENLAEFIRQVIDGEARGLFYPQDAEYATVGDVIRAIRAARGKSVTLTHLFDPLLKLMGGAGAMRRIFGGIVYEKALSEGSGDYRLYTLDEAVRATEGK